MNGIVAGNEAGSEGLAIATATEAFSTGGEGSGPVPATEADCGDDVDVAEDEPREHQLPSGRRTGAPFSRRASVWRARCLSDGNSPVVDVMSHRYTCPSRLLRTHTKANVTFAFQQHSSLNE